LLHLVDMKLLSILLLSSTLLLFGCSKIKQNAKKLDGTWTVYSYAEKVSGGFTTYYEADGNITFNTQADGRFDYSENLSVEKTSGLLHLERTGNGFLFDKKGTSFELNILSPTNEVFPECEISVITKDDLKIKIREPGVERTIVLQKN